MIEGYYEMIAKFLSSVYRPAGVTVPPDPMSIKLAIKALIDNRLATKETLKLAAIRDNNVIIRDDLFPEEEGE